MHMLGRGGRALATGFLIVAAIAQPATVGAQALPGVVGLSLPTTLTAPDPYPRLAPTMTLLPNGQQTLVRPLKKTVTTRGEEVLADRILVRFNQPISDADLADIGAKAAQAGAGAARALVRIGANSIMVDVTGAASIEAAAQAYRGADSRVTGASPDHIMKGGETPNDPEFSKQTGMPRIQAPQAWNRTHGQTGRLIAILDSGLNDLGSNANPEFAGKVVARRDFTGSASGTDDILGHGTHVAGIAAAPANNGLGVAGASYSSNLLIGKVLNDQDEGSMSQATDGIYWAADQGASVINMSFGSTGRQDCDPSWYEDLFDTGRNELRDAINYAWGKNAVLVASAGNDGDTQQLWPAACPNVVSVANTDASDNRWPTSTHGTWVDIAAPGVDIWSTAVPGAVKCNRDLAGSFAKCTGTSMAAPHVSGVVALVQSSCSLSNPAQVVARVMSNADPIPGTGTDWQAGRVNALRAVCYPTPGLLKLGTVYPTSMQLSWHDSTPGESRFELWSQVSGSNAWSVITLPANTSAYTHSGLDAATTYDHKVRSCDPVGCSNFTNTVTATAGFKRLTVSIQGAGKVTAPGINCGQGGSDCTELYAPGTVVTLRQFPYGNLTKNIIWDFDHWEGACAGQLYDCTLTMSTTRSTRAVFVQEEFDL
jgi:thermitase